MRRLSLAIVFALLPAAPALAQTGDGAILPTQALLVVAALLSVCLLVIAGFTLWQSHRFYQEAVHLHQDLRAAHEAFLDRALQLLRESRATPRPAAPAPAGRPAAKRKAPPPPAHIAPAVAPQTEPPAPRHPPVHQPAAPPAAPPPPPAAAVRGNGRNGDPDLSILNDVEYAVLEKLVQDPMFFHTQPLASFGASEGTMVRLQAHGFVTVDGLGRPAVPMDVQTAVRDRFPGR